MEPNGTSYNSLPPCVVVKFQNSIIFKDRIYEEKKTYYGYNFWLNNTIKLKFHLYFTIVYYYKKFFLRQTFWRLSHNMPLYGGVVKWLSGKWCCYRNWPNMKNKQNRPHTHFLYLPSILSTEKSNNYSFIVTNLW